MHNNKNGVVGASVIMSFLYGLFLGFNPLWMILVSAIAYVSLTNNT